MVTPTASGKTLCYNLPVLDRILKDPDARALYLFPTKALAQDQLAELYATIEALGAEIGTFTYDGDTPQDARKAIRARAHVVVTNPDMLHKGILPHHTKWVKLFENLRYVIVDELHSLRGVYGSHVANIFRRLHRLCRFYGSAPQFLCSSATIGNPKELAEALTGRSMRLIDENGAPRGEKYFAIYNPPVVNRQLGIRKSALNSARDVALSFLAKGLQTIVFAPSRLATEVLVTYLKEALERQPGSEGVIRGYRGGYLPLKRREIERGLREGSVLGVVSTNALELGIDIGSLDVAVLRRLPGQRRLDLAAGRARGPAPGHLGRGAGRELDPAQPVHRQAPRVLLRRADRAGPHQPRQPADPREPREVRGLRAAVRSGRELRQGGPERDPALPRGGACPAPGGRALALDERELPGRRGVAAQRLVRQLRGAGHHAASRASSPRSTTTARRRWSTRRPSTSWRARAYFVEKYDHEERRVHVREADVDYYTDAITYTKVKILDRFEEEPVRNARRNHGEVHVTSQVVGFKKIKFYTNENVGSGELQMPENEMHTTSYWLTIPRELMATLPFGGEERRDGVVALSYTLGQMAALFLMCDRHDLGVARGRQRPGRGPHRARHAPAGDGAGAGAAARATTTSRTSSSTTAYPGGIGLSEPLYRLHGRLLDQSLSLIAACACRDGCPSCVGPAGEVGQPRQGGRPRDPARDSWRRAGVEELPPGAGCRRLARRAVDASPASAGEPAVARGGSRDRAGRRRAAHRLPAGAVRLGAPRSGAPAARRQPRPRGRARRRSLPDRRDARPRVAARVAERGARALADRRRPVDGILLTHAHIGHYTGLMYLGREALGAQGVPVYATPRMARFLRENGPWSQLVSLGNIALREIEPGREFALTPDLRRRRSLVPHRDEFSDTVGYRRPRPHARRCSTSRTSTSGRTGTGRSKTTSASVDAAFLDATFFSLDELPGRSQSEVPHPLVGETMQRLARLAPRVRFVHLNHTNRLLFDAARAARGREPRLPPRARRRRRAAGASP